MIARAWFLVVAVVGHPDSVVPRGMAETVYPTRAACMAAAPARVDGLRSIKMHGRYLCMYHGQSDAGLARAPVGTF